MKLTAKEIVIKACKWRNFITPNIIEYGLINENTAYELSEGICLKGEKIYGVTICKYENGHFWNEHDLGKLCESKLEADNYIKFLKEANYDS